jgi:hypothetical protein
VQVLGLDVAIRKRVGDCQQRLILGLELPLLADAAEVGQTGQDPSPTRLQIDAAGRPAAGSSGSSAVMPPPPRTSVAVAGSAFKSGSAEDSLFSQPVSGYRQGWLLAAALGMLVTLLLPASVASTRA